MKPWELTETLDRCTIITDTREQPTARYRAREKQFEKMGCKTRRETVNSGDYTAEFELPDGTPFSLRDVVCVERKMSINEICGNFTHGRERFDREFERLKAAGTKTYLIIEDAAWDKIYSGNYGGLHPSKMRPTALVASLLAFCARYNVIPFFCPPQITAKLIRDIFYYEARERLEALEDGNGRSEATI